MPSTTAFITICPPLYRFKNCPTSPYSRSLPYARPLLLRPRRLHPHLVIPTSQLPSPGADQQLEDDDEDEPMPSSESEAAAYLEQLNRATAQRDASPPDSNTAIKLSRDSIVADAMNNASNAASEGLSPSSASTPATADVNAPSSSFEASPSTARGKYAPIARALWRLSWPVWWLQLLTTGISSAIMLFALAFPAVDISVSASATGLILTAAAVIIAFISLFFTYSYTRLSLWLTSSSSTATSPSTDDRMAIIAPLRIATRLRIGLIVAVLGLCVATLALQAVVGTLLARLLTTGIGATTLKAVPGAASSAATATTTIAAPLVQPIDILVVQAAANVITALLSSLILTTWFRSRASSVWNLEASSKSS